MIKLIKREMVYSNIKYFLFLIIVLLLYNQFQHYIIFYNTNRNMLIKISTNIGISYNINHFLDVIVIILVNTFYIYNSISIYLKNIIYGEEQVFLRISKIKIIIAKIISIFFTTFVYNVFTYFLLILILVTIGDKFNFNIIYLFLVDTIIKTILQYFSLIMFNYIGVIGSFIPVVTLPIIVIMRIKCLNFLFPLSNIKDFNYYYLIIIFIVIFVITIFVCYINLYNLFERKRTYEI